jgi:transposase-like protein
MPWTILDTTELRLKFVTLANGDRYTITELCEEFGISRKGGHKWLERHAQGGAAVSP